MRRLATWLLVSLGIAALVRRLRRRGDVSDPAYDPADELRRRIAESRTEETDTPTPPVSPPETTVDDRRAQVHDEARSTLDEMQSREES